MQLTSGLFVAFLCMVCLVGAIFPGKVRYLWLLACSYGFYLYAPDDWTRNLPALGLLLAATLVSWLCALGMGKSRQLARKRVFLAVALLFSVGMLVVLKYTNCFAMAMAGLQAIASGQQAPDVIPFILPLGASYYILQTVSYSMDVYTGAMQPERNPFLYALYVSFFPGIVTGPINRAPDMLAQYRQPPAFSYDRVAGGLFRVLWGLVKKLVIADSLAPFTSSIFRETDAYWGPQLALGALLFAYQLYAEFGGSCDIVIGAAQMLGFTFMENFERPYAAKTYQGLWQRWHISLTSFFRDYVFTPLVWSRWTEKLPVIGKKVTKPPALSGVLIIFLLSGLWHGDLSNAGNILYYAIWGLLNGLIMMLATKYGKKKEKLMAKVPVYSNRYVRGVVQRVLVYLMFAGCLVFFAFALYGTSAPVFFNHLHQGWGAWVRGSLDGGAFFTPLKVGLLALGVLGVELVEMCAVKPGSTVGTWIRSRRWWLRWPLYYLLLAALVTFGAFGQSAFIYQQF